MYKQTILLGLLIVSLAAHITALPTDPYPSSSHTKYDKNHDNYCMRSGCSGEICSTDNMASPCIFRPEYACYAVAECTQLKNGTCGWVSTPEFVQCVMVAGANVVSSCDGGGDGTGGCMSTPAGAGDDGVSKEPCAHGIVPLPVTPSPEPE